MAKIKVDKQKTREFIYIIAGQSAALIGNVVFIKVLTSWMPPQIYGEVGLIMSLSALVGCLFSGPVSQAAYRYYQRYDAERRLHYLAKSVLLLVFAGYALSVLLWGAWAGLEISSGRDHWIIIGLAVLGFVFTIFQDLSSLVISVLSVLKRRLAVGVLQSISIWVRLGFVATIFYLFGVSAWACLIGYITGALVTLLISCCVATGSKLGLDGARDIETRKDRHILLGFAWPYVIWGIFGWFQSSADRWIVELYLNRQQLGTYVLAVQLGVVFPMVMSGALMSLIGPYIYQEFNTSQERRQNYLKWVRLVAALYLGGCIVVFALSFFYGPLVLSFLSGKEYAPAAFLWPWTLLVSMVFYLGEIIATPCMVEEKPKWILPGKILGGITGVLAAFLGVAYLGLSGIILGMLAGSATYTGLTAIASYKASAIWANS